MKPTYVLNPTNKFAPPENWDEEKFGKCGILWVRRQTEPLVELFSAWKPSPEELALLNAGGVVEVGLCTMMQCAMSVNVVEPVPEPLAEAYENAKVE